MGNVWIVIYDNNIWWKKRRNVTGESFSWNEYPANLRSETLCLNNTLKSLRLPQQVEKFPVDVLNHKMKDKIDISVFYELYRELKTLTAVFITLMEAAGSGLELRLAASYRTVHFWHAQSVSGPHSEHVDYFNKSAVSGTQWLDWLLSTYYLLANNEGEVRTSSAEQKWHQYSSCVCVSVCRF